MGWKPHERFHGLAGGWVFPALPECISLLDEGSAPEKYTGRSGPLFPDGRELSYLGFPQTDELSVVSNGEEVRYSNFQGGSILWTANRGAFLIPSFSPITERHALGAWLFMVGKGFTPNNRVTFWIVNAPNAPQSMGSTYAASDGTFGANRSLPVDLRNRSGNHEASIARAVDEATGQVSDYRLSYALY